MITGNGELGVTKQNASARKGAEMSALRRRERGKVMAHAATSEREYSNEDMEFLRAIEAYKTRSGRQFPSWTEVLSVVREIGYVKPM